MDINVFEETINTFASDLITLDCSSEPEVSQYINIIKAFIGPAKASGVSSAGEIIEIMVQSQDKLKGIDETKVNAALTCLISSIQNVITMHKSGQSLADSPKIFQVEFEAAISGNVVENVSDLVEEPEDFSDFISCVLSTLDDAEKSLLDLEKNGNNPEEINKVFRLFHTIKGDSNLLNLSNLSSLAHEAENLLENLRSKTIVLDGDIISSLLDVVDFLKKYCDLLSVDFKEAVNSDLSPAINAIKLVLDQRLSEFSQGESSEDFSLEDKPEVVVKADDKKQDDVTSPKKCEHVCQIPTLDLSEGLDVLTEFSQEAVEHLTGAEEAIMTLEDDPNDSESVDGVFRAFHTIKGLASFLELEDIRVLAHTSETVLDLVRKKELIFEGVVVDAIFQSIDDLKKLLVLLMEQVGFDGKLESPYFEVSSQISALKGIINGTDLPVTGETKPVGEILVDEGDITDGELNEALVLQSEAQKDKKVGEILQGTNAVSQKSVRKALNIQKGVTESSIKIRVDKLDQLIDMVGELVISETQVVQNPATRLIENQKFIKDLAELDRITRTLQEVAMGMRLVPVKSTFQKMLRIVRDLSRKAEKDINVMLSGEDTEIDKNMVELISDPLVHMVRNSCDHGIESKEDRISKGKSAKGNISLSAFHRGGNVVIEIRDDGAGLNKEKILQKAIERGIVSGNEDLPDKKIFNMIFEAGFSTAAKVTDVSGRGVGMDVVRRNIEELRGKVEIDSEIDKGSVFSIYLPITLAIIEGIVIKVADERYIFPINSIIEFVQAEKKYLSTIAQKGEMFRVHGEVFPLYRLNEYFGVPSLHQEFEKNTLCLVDSDRGKAIFLVDELLGQQQVVIKNLGEKMKDIRGITGGAILGDGRVGLILDVNGVIESF